MSPENNVNYTLNLVCLIEFVFLEATRYLLSMFSKLTMRFLGVCF